MKYRIYITFFFIFLFISGFSQSKKENLENERKKNLKEIEYTDRLLKQTSKQKKETYNKFLIIGKRIQLRNRVINTIENQIESSEFEIERMNDKIIDLGNILIEEKKEYKNLINVAYKRKNTRNNLMYVLASDNFNQAYKRLKYLQQYISFRKDKISKIEITKTNLESITDSLKNEKFYLENLKDEKLVEKDELENEKNKETKLLGSLKKKEKELKKELSKQKRIASRIRKEIEEIFKLAGNTVNYKLTPEEKIISGNFAKNLGLLPWPTERGVVIEKFGEHFHPVLKGIRVQNNGVNIGTTIGAECRSVFEGEVKSIINIPGANKAIIIRHGSYLTVYTNLVSVLVKKGDKVKTKDIIGKVFTNKIENNKTVIHFEIWEENKKLNPELWLSKN